MKRRIFFCAWILAGMALEPGPVPGAVESRDLAAARKAVASGAMTFGSSGAFEGDRALSSREDQRLLDVLGAYLGRALDRTGVFERPGSPSRNLIQTHWAMARFLRDQRVRFRDLLDHTGRLLDSPPSGLFHYRCVEQAADLVAFRADNIRFLEDLQGLASDPALKRPITQLARLLEAMDERTRRVQRDLTGVLSNLPLQARAR